MRQMMALRYQATIRYFQGSRQLGLRSDLPIVVMWWQGAETLVGYAMLLLCLTEVPLGSILSSFGQSSCR
jgi:hypothetical protein